MTTSRRYTFAFSAEVAARLDAAVPLRQRNAFVERAVREQLRLLERERLQTEMEECAREMYDEMLQIETEFRPLEEEIHRER